MNPDTLKDVLQQIGISIATYMLYYGVADDDHTTVFLKDMIQRQRNLLPDTEEISDAVRKYILDQCTMWAERDEGAYIVECKYVHKMYENAPLGVKSSEYLM